jgi:hypothetical protein
MKALIVVALSAPAGLIADDKKDKDKGPAEMSVEAYDSKTKGAIQVNGEKSDWFDVRKGEKSLAFPYPLLGKVAEVEPGEYEVWVNKVVRKVKVEAGKKTVLETGSIHVEGKSGLYWYPLVGKDEAIGPNRLRPGLNQSISLFPGVYAVEVNLNLRTTQKLTDKAVVEPGNAPQRST